jgi:hypothetical protein
VFKVFIDNCLVFIESIAFIEYKFTDVNSGDDIFIIAERSAIILNGLTVI